MPAMFGYNTLPANNPLMASGPQALLKRKRGRLGMANQSIQGSSMAGLQQKMGMMGQRQPFSVPTLNRRRAFPGTMNFYSRNG